MGLIKNIYSTSEAFKSHLQFWDAQIALMEETILFNRDAEQYNEYEQLNIDIPKETEVILRRYSNNQDIGLFVLMSSMVAYATHVYRNQKSVRIDTPVLKGAPQNPETTTVPLVFNLESANSLRDYISHVKQIVSQSYSYQQLPLAQFYDLEQSASNVFLCFDKLHGRPASFKHVLNIIISNDDQLRITVHFSRAIRRSAAEGFARCVIRLLTQFDDLSRSLNTLSVADEPPLSDGVGSEAIDPLRKPEPFLAQFDRVVHAHGDHLAIVKEGVSSITFACLDELSDRLAAFLKARYNIDKGSRVGILAEKTHETVVVLVAVMKLGAIYVPINPASPRERIAHIVNDASLSVMLIQSTHLNVVSNFYRLPMIALDLQLKRLKESPLSSLPEVSLNDPAYIVYTSGTSGQPKGVLCDTEGILIAAKYYADLFQLNAGDRYLQFLSLAFDGAMLDIFVSLITGATLVFPSPSSYENADDFVRELSQLDVTLTVLTPSFARNIKHTAPDFSKHLRTLVFAGEALYPNDISGLNGSLLFNAYGPTEASVVTAVHLISSDDIAVSGSVPIGKAVPGRTVLVLDDALRICPPEVRGEIYIAGSAVAHGYVNSPELSFAQFIDRGEGRMYRTGDLGYVNHDGQLVFVGRKDTQLKLNGYRVDLSEIDTALLGISGVKRVVTFFDESRESLSACIIAGSEVSESSLRKQLEEKLPAYMVPNRFFLMDAFPLDQNGKVNLSALKQQASEDEQTGYVDAETETEKTIQVLWMEVLGTARISVEENFFNCGGNSLKAIHILTKIQKAFGQRIGINVLFANPTIKGLSRIVDNAAVTAYVDVVQPLEEQDYYSVAASQKQLWLLNQLSENKAAYNVASAYRIQGELDRIVFETAINELIARHENLRAIFVLKDGSLVQRISETPFSSMEFHDLNFGNVDTTLSAYLTRALTTDFLLDQKPPFEVHLLRTAVDEHIVLFLMHHIIADGWALQVLFTELIQYYEAISQGRKPNVERLRIQGKDFGSWQAKRIAKSADAHRQYWMEKLKGAQHRINLPADRPAPVMKSFRGDQLQRWLTEELSGKISDLARSLSISKFSLLTAVTKVLIYRYSGQRDLCVGSTVLNRNHETLRNQVGFYLDTVILRNVIRPEMPFTEFLKDVNSGLNEAIQHHEYNLDEMISDLKLPRTGSYSPLFNVLIESVDVNSGPVPEVQLGNITIDHVPLEFPYSKYDLTFKFYHDQKIGIGIEYDTDIFDASTIEEWFDSLSVLLDSVVADPQTPIVDLRILTRETVAEILGRGRGKSLEMKSDTVIDSFQRIAENLPEKVAIQHAGEVVTYGELEHESLKIASYLLNDCNIAPGSAIAISLVNSPASIAAILGVLRAGMVFVPLDPELPQKRRQFILKDSDAKLLVTESSYMFDFPDFSKTIFAIDVQLNALPLPGHKLPFPGSPDSNAYIIYTSGTTGTPKGVVISHSNLFNYVSWANQYYFNNSAGYSFALFTSVSFDLTLTSIFTTLVRGDEIFIPYERQVDKMLEEILRPESKVNTIKLTPSHVNILKFLTNGSALKKVIVGGEAFTRAQADVLFKLNSNIEVYNEYGPTETTIGCTVCEVKSSGGITIGTPIANCDVAVFDEYGDVQPFGVVGELHVGGHGVMQGYLNQSDLTAAKIDDDILSKKRYYKTGDLALLRRDGVLEFRGRKDSQVKINGYRVETEEIDAVLESHPEVKHTVTVLHVINPPVLVAFYTSGKTIGKEEFHAFLSDKLPVYMVPQRFIRLDFIPQTLNNKVDKEKLLARIEEEVVKVRIHPRSETERAVVSIWENLLGTSDFCVTDNFFDLGGNSLLAIQCYLRINEVFVDKKINVAQVYSHSSVEKLASLLGPAEAVTVRKKITVVDL